MFIPPPLRHGYITAPEGQPNLENKMCMEDSVRRKRSRMVDADEIHTLNKRNKQFLNSSDSNKIMDNRLTGISPAERMSSMFETGLYSDCSFLIEDQEVRAHRLVLALASPKMEELFLGENRDPIEVPFSSRVMQIILKHCYLQDMDIESLDEAQDVIEAAHWFKMKDLVELCCAAIEPQTLDDLWPALNLACMHNSRALKESCLAIALQNSSTILSHEGILLLSAEAFSYLLEREVFDISSEQEILDTAIAWAQNQLQNSVDEESTLRHELEKSEILKNIRILALPEKDFINFLTGIGKEIFTEEELEKIEYNYFSDTCEKYISPLRTDRMLEQRIPICGYDYLSVNSDNNKMEIGVRIFETPSGIRPIVKTLILPSQINPANILYDNVSHRTHYNECILSEVIVNDTIVSRGSFYGRIKYSDDIYINLNTFRNAALYTNNNLDEDGNRVRYYEAKIKVMFKTYGFYPLAIETKRVDAVELLDKSRFIHEIVLASPKL